MFESYVYYDDDGWTMRQSFQWHEWTAKRNFKNCREDTLNYMHGSRYPHAFAIVRSKDRVIVAQSKDAPPFNDPCA